MLCKKESFHWQTPFLVIIARGYLKKRHLRSVKYSIVTDKDTEVAQYPRYADADQEEEQEEEEVIHFVKRD